MKRKSRDLHISAATTQVLGDITLFVAAVLPALVALLCDVSEEKDAGARSATYTDTDVDPVSADLAALLGLGFEGTGGVGGVDGGLIIHCESVGIGRSDGAGIGQEEETCQQQEQLQSDAHDGDCWCISRRRIAGKQLKVKEAWCTDCD